MDVRYQTSKEGISGHEKRCYIMVRVDHRVMFNQEDLCIELLAMKQ